MINNKKLHKWKEGDCIVFSLNKPAANIHTLPEGDKSVYIHCTYHCNALGDFEVKLR